MLKKAVAVALLLALLAPAAALAQGTDEIRPRTMNDLVGVVKDIVRHVMLLAGFVLVALAAWQGVKIAKSGVEPRERAEAVSGLAYLLFGAMVCFGAYFWLGVAKGLVPQ